jgi:hypothetical protein
MIATAEPRDVDQRLDFIDHWSAHPNHLNWSNVEAPTILGKRSDLGHHSDSWGVGE